MQYSTIFEFQHCLTNSLTQWRRIVLWIWTKHQSQWQLQTLAPLTCKLNNHLERTRWLTLKKKMVHYLSPSTAPSQRRPSAMMTAHLSSGHCSTYWSQRNWWTQLPLCLNTWNCLQSICTLLMHISWSFHTTSASTSQQTIFGAAGGSGPTTQQCRQVVDIFPSSLPKSKRQLHLHIGSSGISRTFLKVKVIKATSSWFCKTKFGLWKSLLQSKKISSIGMVTFLSFVKIQAGYSLCNLQRKARVDGLIQERLVWPAGTVPLPIATGKTTTLSVARLLAACCC